MTRWLRRLVGPLGFTAFFAVVALLDFVGVISGTVAGGLLFLTVLSLLLFGFYKATSGPLSRVIGRVGVGLRWKIGFILSTIIALVVFGSVINFEAMDYMHQEIHSLQELSPANGPALMASVNELEQTSHGPLFDLAPRLALLGGLVALGLGLGLARSVLTALSGMDAGLKRIAAGNFDEPIRVTNKDELGALAQRINQAAVELAQTQEATLAAERAEALKERIAQVTRAQEDERRRISRELHDDLGPSLAAIANRLRASRPLIRDDPGQVEADLDEVCLRLTGHIQDIRELIHDLRPMALDQLGLAEALRQHVERFGQETGIPTTFTSHGAMELNPLAEMTVLRVVQESLGNVQRHANASHVAVSLVAADGVLTATVSDDGRGFDTKIAHDNGERSGLGLVGMRERADLLRGTVSLESRPGNGCRMVLTLPQEEVTRGAYPNAAR
ncbi:MAG: histidine kinase [Dehalococcoidia bacterium]